ncbi:MAG TPA: hypothetical protein VF603_10930 [Allosphingosinicella sp.]|jgi:hypothetical protein
MSGSKPKRRNGGKAARAEAARRLDGQAMGAFLAALEQGATISAAARATGCGRSTAYNRRDGDPAFRTAWDEAAEKAAARS